MDRSEFKFERRNVVACATAFVMAVSMSLPATAFADESALNGSDGARAVVVDAQPDAEPAGAIAIDKGEAYEEAPEVSSPIALFSYSYTRITPMQLSDNMKYFTLYESGRNYNQGFSSGDGYHAMGYYQFDNRYSLQDFMQGCYWYDPSTFSMFKWATDSSLDLSSSAMAVNGQLTELGQKAQDSWHAAYAAAPGLFAQLQDGYAYTTYYVPAERYLKSIGVDISDRNDAVKGLSWGMCVLFGSGGMQYYFNQANLTSDMTDTEFVTNVCNSIIDNVASRVNNYALSYQNRYERELKTCLSIIDQTGDTRVPVGALPDAATASAVGNEPAPAPSVGEVSGAGEASGAGESNSGSSASSGSNANDVVSSGNGSASGAQQPSQPAAPSEPAMPSPTVPGNVDASSDVSQGSNVSSGNVGSGTQDSNGASSAGSLQPSSDAADLKSALPAQDASNGASSNAGSSSGSAVGGSASGSSEAGSSKANENGAGSSASSADTNTSVKGSATAGTPGEPTSEKTSSSENPEQDITQLSLSKAVDATSKTDGSQENGGTKASGTNTNNANSQSQVDANTPQQGKKLSQTNDSTMKLIIAMAAAAVVALVVIGVVVFRMTRRRH